MSTQNSEIDSLLDELATDVTWILIEYYVFRCKSSSINGSMSRTELVLELIAIDSLVKSIVMRLTGLDDDQKGTRSFRDLSKQLPKDRGIAAKWSTAIKSYRSTINALKTQHRNVYMAHMRLGGEAAAMARDWPDLAPSVTAAVEAVDVFTGATKKYVFRVGSQEAEIDLRMALAHVFTTGSEST